MPNQFASYIGIDYSGAETPVSRLKGLRVFKASLNTAPETVASPAGEDRNWTRREVARWCIEKLQREEAVIIGIDHGFSFPISYMQDYGIRNWDHFLEDFQVHWPTDEDHRSAEQLRYGNQRTGKPTDFRLTEKWTASVQSVFKLDGAGTVGKSTHCGIPWLRYIRENVSLRNRVHFWPFDGYEIPPGKSAVVEVYPSIFRKRYIREAHHSIDDHDARCVALWLKEMDGRGLLNTFFNPPLTEKERKIVNLEGWILGVY